MLAWLLPGLLFCAAGIWWAVSLIPHTYVIPSWNGIWEELGQPAGRFRCWRISGDFVYGESQPFPPDHPRAFTVLVGPTLGPMETTVVAKIVLDRRRGFFIDFPIKGSDDRYLRVALGNASQPQSEECSIARVGPTGIEPLAKAKVSIPVGEVVDVKVVSRPGRMELHVDGTSTLSTDNVDPLAGPIRIGLNASSIRIFELQVSPKQR